MKQIQEPNSLNESLQKMKKLITHKEGVYISNEEKIKLNENSEMEEYKINQTEYEKLSKLYDLLIELKDDGTLNGFEDFENEVANKCRELINRNHELLAKLKH